MIKLVELWKERAKKKRKNGRDRAASKSRRIHSASPRPPFTFFVLSYFLHRVLDIPPRNFRSLPAANHRGPINFKYINNQNILHITHTAKHQSTWLHLLENSNNFHLHLVFYVVRNIRKVAYYSGASEGFKNLNLVEHFSHVLRISSG